VEGTFDIVQVAVLSCKAALTSIIS